MAFSIPFSIFIGQIAAGLVLLTGLFAMINSRGYDMIRSRWFILIPLFLLLTLISAALSGYFNASVPRLSKIWVMLCFFPLVAMSPWYSGKKAIDFLILGTTVASIFALYRYFSGITGRAAPFSGGYTTLAISIAGVLPFTIQNMVSTRATLKWIYICSGILMFSALFFTKTRAGWAAAVIGLLIIGFSINKKRTFIGLILGLAILAAMPTTRKIALDRFRDDRKGGVSSGRTVIYQAALVPLENLPFFGYGPGSFNRLVSNETLERIGDTGIKSWHSTPLEILLESGPLTLFIFMAMAFLPLRESMRQARLFPESRRDSYAAAASLTAIYLAGLTTNLIRDFMLLSLIIIIWSIPAAQLARISYRSQYRKENNTGGRENGE